MDGDYRSDFPRVKQKAACPRENTDRPVADRFLTPCRKYFFVLQQGFTAFSRVWRSVAAQPPEAGPSRKIYF
ncbi:MULTISPECIES: hypothetical protein [Burkholderia]|uniref:hypothetical protein n=1 Tax=Burkholderia TaxID=32008 RepID=UPI001269C9F9|nr:MULTISPECIES: hypothetical protein [Burkholderia]